MQSTEQKRIFHHITFSRTDRTDFEERELHTYHEILYIIDGNVTLLTEQFQQHLSAGTLIVIPRGQYHFFRIHSDTFSRLKISLPNAPELSVFSQVRILTENAVDRHLIDRMLSALSENENNEQSGLILYGALWTLLAGAAESPRNPNPRDASHLISRAVAFIDSHLTESVSVSTLAKELLVSESTLTHSFRKDMGISLHQYILQKRLFHADEQLMKGAAPTKIFSLCGFGDYTAFYKAYKKMFGYPPSKKRIQE